LLNIFRDKEKKKKETKYPTRFVESGIIEITTFLRENKRSAIERKKIRLIG